MEKYTDLTTFNLADYLKNIYNNKEKLDLNSIKRIFDMDVDLTKKTNKGVTSFMLAILFNNIELINLFIDKGVDINETTIFHPNKEDFLNSPYADWEDDHFKENITLHPIDFLFSLDWKNNKTYDRDVIALLIENGLDLKRNILDLNMALLGIEIIHSSSILVEFVKLQDEQSIKLFLNKIPFLNEIEKLELPIENLIKDTNLDLLKLLVEHGYSLKLHEKRKFLDEDIGFFDDSLINLTFKKNKLFQSENEIYEIVKYLIENGCDVNYDNPLMTAVNFQQKQLTSDNDIIRYGFKLSPRVVKLLVENGADVNFIDEDGKSILMATCGAKNMYSINELFSQANTIKFEIVKFLIKHGANIHHKDNKQNNLLMYLDDHRTELSTYIDVKNEKYPKEYIFEKHPSEMILKYLIEIGIDIDNRNYMGVTPLMHFALNEKSRLVRILLDNGANANIKIEKSIFDFIDSKDDELKEIVTKAVPDANKINEKKELFKKQYSDLATFNLADYLVNLEELDLELIKYILEQNVDLNIKSSKKGTSCFGLALILESDELAKLLLSYGFDINSVDKRGLNAFHWAVILGNYTISKLLIEKGADINAKVNFEVKYYEKDTSETSIIERLKYLYAEEESENNEDEDIIGFDSNYKPKIKTVQLSSFALSFNTYNPKIVKLLLEKGFDPNEDVLRENSILEFLKDDIASEYLIENNPIDIICENNDVELLKLMIEKGATRFDTSNLFEACKNLNFKMIKIFVDNKVEINYKDNKKWSDGNPLTIICANSTIEPCEGNCGSNVNVKSSEVLEMIIYLVENGADVNIESPLMAACSLKYKYIKEPGNDLYADVNLDIVRVLIENGADVNYRDNDGKSILMHAMNRCNGYKLVKILIENGANINNPDNLGNNEIMNIDADSNLSNEDKGGYIQVLNYLIDRGCNINIKNAMGFTPLMKFSFENDYEFIKILLDKGADINLKSEMTAFDLAQNDEIKSLINESKNNSPQNLVKILSNFTIDKPIKYTTHIWDFGDLKSSEYKNFDGYIKAVKKQFESMENELKNLSSNLYKKIHTFLLEENPDENYSWCQKTSINIGWSNLEGLKQWCNEGGNPFDFTLKKSIFIGRKQIVKFGEIINLFKQEIEIRADFENLKQIFASQNIELDLTSAKLNTRQFYTDTQKLSAVLNKIFAEMKKREDLKI